MQIETQAHQQESLKACTVILLFVFWLWLITNAPEVPLEVKEEGTYACTAYIVGQMGDLFSYAGGRLLERTYVAQGKQAMSRITSAEELFFAERGVYLSFPTGKLSDPDLGGRLMTDIKDTDHWAFAVSPPSSGGEGAHLGNSDFKVVAQCLKGPYKGNAMSRARDGKCNFDEDQNGIFLPQ